MAAVQYIFISLLISRVVYSTFYSLMREQHIRVSVCGVGMTRDEILDE